MEAIGPPHFRGGSVRGELVTLTGRQKGQRRLLSVPLTFIGRAAVCDVRLNLPGIDPFHCLFVFVPTGLMIRDLNSSTGTFINGERISQVSVQDGDTLAVGTFQFLIRLWQEESDTKPAESSFATSTTSPSAAGEPTLEPDAQSEGGPQSLRFDATEAMRIQAAAIAAQHAAVTEEEIRLWQRQSALHEQEQQLSRRFERERLELEALHTQTQAERDALHRERNEYEDFVALVSTCLGDAQKELVESYQKIQLERRRLAQADQRIKKHNQALLTAKQKDLDRREEQLADETATLQTGIANLAKRTRALEQERIQLVTDHELARRGLSESWQNLRREQASWRKRRGLERTAISVRERDLYSISRDIVNDARALSQGKKAWLLEKQILTTELTCLEQRIRNRRGEIRRQDQCGPILSPVSCLLSPNLPPAFDPSLILASMADQRAELIEHWQILALTDEVWQAERRRIVADLECLAMELQEQESRQRHDESCLARRRDELIVAEEQTAAWRARLHAEEIAWQADRARMLAEVQTREELASRQTANVAKALEGWNRRRVEELAQLRKDRQDCARLHEELLALQRLWRHDLPDAAQLRSLLSAIDARFKEAEQRLHAALAERAELSKQKTDLEKAQIETSQRTLQNQREMQLSEARRLTTVKELADTRDELDRLANVLLSKPALPAVSADKAA